IADALERLSLPVKYLPSLKLWSPDYVAGMIKVVGKAFTVQIVKADDTATKFEGQWVDRVEENSVIVISVPSGCVNAVFGGITATRSKFLGAKGCVIDGRFRDLDELRAMGFPVFAQGPSILSAKGRTKAVAVQLPVTVDGGVVIDPSDIIVGDLNGVVVLPGDKIDAVARECQLICDIDKKCEMDVKNGSSVHEAFKRWRG
ncbi:RraA-like protein, partial [Paraphysoderma sedebokerense]